VSWNGSNTQTVDHVLFLYVQILANKHHAWLTSQNRFEREFFAEAQSYFSIKRVQRYDLPPKVRREAYHATVDILEMRVRRRPRCSDDGGGGDSHNGEHIAKDDEVSDRDESQEFDYDQAGYTFEQDDE
jgi:hypothetical protein